MEKTTTLNLRVNPEIKQDAEAILRRLGIPMSTAVDIYLRQIILHGGLPFAVTVPLAPAHLNADNMTDEELHAAIDEAYQGMLAGHVIPMEEFEAQMHEKYGL